MSEILRSAQDDNRAGWVGVLGFAIHGSVLLLSAEICVICGNFGCNEAQIEKEWRHAQFEARRESCP